MNRASASLLLIGLGGAVVLAACGGGAESAAPAKAPGRASDSAREPEREPSSVAEAQEQITRAREDLGELEKSEASGDKDSAAAPSTGTAGGTSSTTAKPKAPPAAREEKASASPADPCAQSCRALTSMRRAVSALCRMTGDEDARCSDARKTLQQSESRVAQCHCGP